jgi:galactokinase
MYTGLILLILSGQITLPPLQDSIVPLPVKPQESTKEAKEAPVAKEDTPTTIVVENSQVESTQVTMEIDKEKIEELEKLGTVLERITITTDKYPKPDLEIIMDDEVVPGELVLLSLDGKIPDEVAKVDVTWSVLEIVSTGKEWTWKERKIKVDDKSCFFGAGIKQNKFFAVADVTYLYIDGINCTQTKQRLTKEIRIGDSPLPLPDPIIPDPKPVDPTFAPGQFNAAKIGWDSRGEMSKAQADILLKAYEETIQEVGRLEGVQNPVDITSEDDLTKFGQIMTNHKNRVQKAFSDASVPKPDFWLKSAQKIEDAAPIVKRLFEAWHNREIKTWVDLNTYYGEVKLGLIEIKNRAK